MWAWILADWDCSLCSGLKCEPGAWLIETVPCVPVLNVSLDPGWLRLFPVVLLPQAHAGTVQQIRAQPSASAFFQIHFLALRPTVRSCELTTRDCRLSVHVASAFYWFEKYGLLCSYIHTSVLKQTSDYQVNVHWCYCKVRFTLVRFYSNFIFFETFSKNPQI